MRRNPTTIDEKTWFYSDKKSLEVVHEFYEAGEFKRIARFSIPQSLLEQLLSQSDSPDELRELIKHFPAILTREFEEVAREKELRERDEK